MALTNVQQTYGDVSRKEDVVLNAVEILTATEQQISNIIGKSVAIDTIHSYLTDTLATPASIAVEQASDYTNIGRTAPARLTNIVQEMAVPFRVSKLQDSVQHYHGVNELERQTQKALREFGNGLEFDLVRSTLVSGVSGTVARMAGIISAISKSTNTTAHTSGTAFTATILDGLMQDNWTNSNGEVATDLYVGPVMRRVIDNFAQKTNVVVNAPGISSIVRTVSSYDTSMGTLQVHKHRYVDIAGTDLTCRVLGINPAKLKMAWLTKPIVQNDLAKSGNYEPRAIYGSGTLEVNNQDSNFFASGFLRSA